MNIALLFIVSIEPFLFWVLVSQPQGTTLMSPILEIASTLYALDVGVMMLLLAVFNYLLLAEERTAAAKAPFALRERIRWAMWGRVGIGTLFLVSALPAFWTPDPGGGTVRIDLWYVGLALIIPLTRVTWKRRIRRGPLNAG